MPAIASAEGPILVVVPSGVDLVRVGAVVAVDLAHDVELLRHDAVGEAEAADELVADADPGVRRDVGVPMSVGDIEAAGSPVFVNAAALSVNTALCGRIRIPPLIAARKRPR